MAEERLHKVMAGAGFGSRRACEQMILDGKVQVNGRTVTEVGVKVDPAQVEIVVDGVPLRMPDRHIYIKMNKPRNVVSDIGGDTGDHKSVSDLLPADMRRVFPVGRLDLNSEGLVLLTDDGDLAHRLTHPSYEHPKTYYALVEEMPTAQALEQLRTGIDLPEGRTAPARIRVVDGPPSDLTLARGPNEGTWLEVILYEGKKRQIRHMLAAVNYPVRRLVRWAIGPLTLGRVRPGEWTLMRAEDANALRRFVDLPPTAVVEAEERSERPRTRGGRAAVAGAAAGAAASRSRRSSPPRAGGSDRAPRRRDDDRSDSQRPRRSSSSGGSRPYSDRPRSEGGRPASGGSRSYSDRPRSEGGRPPGGGTRSYSDRPRSEGGRPASSGGSRSYSDRPRSEGGRPASSGGSRSYSDRPRSEGGRPASSGGSRSYSDRPRSEGGRPASSGGSRSYSDRPRGEGGRPASSGGSRPYSDRPRGEGGRPASGGGSRSYSDRPRAEGGRPPGGGSRPYSDRPRSEGGRPASGGSRPYSDRPRPPRPPSSGSGSSGRSSTSGASRSGQNRPPRKPRTTDEE